MIYLADRGDRREQCSECGHVHGPDDVVIRHVAPWGEWSTCLVCWAYELVGVRVP